MNTANQNRPRINAGGSATSSGINYQYRVGAWFAVQILAEKEITIPWGFPPDTVYESIRFETEYPVDDILVETSNSRLFIQVKHTIGLEKNQSSSLSTSLEQAVRLYLTHKSVKSTFERNFSPEKDKILFVVNSNSPSSITSITNSLLDKIRKKVPLSQLSKENLKCLSILSTHVKRAWINFVGIEPSEDLITSLLSCIYILVLNIESDEADEILCKNILRSSILKNYNQVDLTWNSIIQIISDLTQIRAGIDRENLQDRLIKLGIEIKAPISFRAEIDNFIEYTKNTFENLSPLSKIEICSKIVKVNRIYADEIVDIASELNILVVGEPGAGKSGVLIDVVEKLQKKGEDVVFLAVDRITESNLKDELCTSYPLHKVLQNWPGIRPAYLIIDALDGARNENTAHQIQQLIKEVVQKKNRWHIIASVRKYDLRYNLELKNLFRGQLLIKHIDEEFKNVQHINIQDFSNEEILQVQNQSLELSQLFQIKELNESSLLKKPFNLRLLGELIDIHFSTELLNPIHTQSELLSLYWYYRIIKNDGRGDSREFVLRQIARSMLSERSMFVSRSTINNDIHLGIILNDLLHTNVIIEWQSSQKSKIDRNTLAFSHNMLFDYGISRLILLKNHTSLVDELSCDPELSLVIRPSIVYCLHDLWFIDDYHNQFWKVVFSLYANTTIPLIGKLIGASVIVDLVKNLDDLKYLLTELSSTNQEQKIIAENIIKDLSGALLTFWPEKDENKKEKVTIWAKFAEIISKSLNTSLAYSILPIVTKISDKSTVLDIDQKVICGSAARKILEFGWSLQGHERNQRFINHAIEAVCLTFEGNPFESRELINIALESEHMTNYGYTEMPSIAYEIKEIIKVDPDFAHEIYIKVFSHTEKNKESTSMGGKILNLTSTRSQDFHMAQWHLAEQYPFFIEQSPIYSVKSLISIINNYFEKEHHISNYQRYVFTFRNQEVNIHTDQSYIWGSASTYNDDEPIKMLNIFFSMFPNIFKDTLLFEKVLDLIIKENSLAVFWKRMIIVATTFPSTLGCFFRQLSWTRPLLICSDTTFEIGNFITVIYEYLNTDERKLVEEAILNIANERKKFKNKSYAIHDRNRLLGCIPEKEINLDISKRIISKLKKANKIPKNRPLFSIKSYWSDISNEEILQEQGVLIEQDENKQILILQKPIKEFVNSNQKSDPTIKASNEILQVILQLEGCLNKYDELLDIHVKDMAWGYIAESCRRIASIDTLNSLSDLGKNIKRILLQLSKYPNPKFNIEQDSNFEKFASWASPSARIDAASGLMMLSHDKGFLDSYLLECLNNLAHDQVAAVRFQIASSLNALTYSSNEFMWDLLQYFSREEKNYGVLKGCVYPLYKLVQEYPNEVFAYSERLLNRSNDFEESDSLAKSCISIILGLYIWKEHKESEKSLNSLLTQKNIACTIGIHIAYQLRDSLNYYSNSTVRLRSVKILKILVNICIDTYKEVKEIMYDPSEDQMKQIKDMYLLADALSMTIFFSSGAFDEKENSKTQDKILSLDEKLIFLNELGPLISQLSEVSFSKVIHYLVQTLEILIPADPISVFLLLHHLIISGKDDNYQFESIAADHIVKIIDRYLAEYRYIFRQNLDCQKYLIEILDIFVSAGWTNARKLTYRLEEIYR